MSAHKKLVRLPRHYATVLGEIVELLASARREAAKSVNAVMTTTYWQIGRRIVEHEQRGVRRAGYGQELLKRLAADLTARFGQGFSKRNLEQMRLFYVSFPFAQTLSAQSRERG